MKTVQNLLPSSEVGIIGVVNKTGIGQMLGSLVNIMKAGHPGHGRIVINVTRECTFGHL